MLAPILVLIAFIGVYPKPFLERIEPSARKIVDQLDGDGPRDVPVPPEVEPGPVAGGGDH
jgi:NADH:ubiquinone oxidoreductase subunit 4 (subunit M)